MNILITGGFGFKGSSIMRHLDSMDTVDVIVNIDNISATSSSKNAPRTLKTKHFTIDINNVDTIANILKNFQITHVLHFAEESDKSAIDDAHIIDVNINGTTSLLLACARYGKLTHFFHSSTSYIYGELNDYDPRSTEESSYKPQTIYASSKAASNLIVKAYCKKYNIPFTIGNACNIFGAGQYKNKLIPKAINNILRDEVIQLYGTGTGSRCWLYIDDYSKAVWSIINNIECIGEEFIISSDYELSNIQIIDKICDITQKDITRVISYITDVDSNMQRCASNFAKLTKFTNWSPLVNFESGIDFTVNHYISLT